jgi:hypothetical protein
MISLRYMDEDNHQQQARSDELGEDTCDPLLHISNLMNPLLNLEVPLV